VDEDRHAFLLAISRVRSSERESMTTSSSTSGTRSTKRERMARMTLRIVASSLTSAAPRDPQVWRSFASTSAEVGELARAERVFGEPLVDDLAEHTIRSARSSGRRVRSTNIGEASGALVRTTSALRASAMIR